MNSTFYTLCFLILTVAAAGSAPSEVGLVARWDFDEGKGDVLRDTSGYGNHGKIHGAKWVRSGKGYALRFDGVDDYVDCGNGPSLDIRGPITLEAWVHPDAPAIAEPGLAGKFFDSYALTYYKTGSCYMYISGGGNNAYGAIEVGKWSHVAGVFDGKTIRFYVNGRETIAQPSQFSQTNPGKNFLMGCVIGDPTNIDEALRRTAYFAGMLDAVRVYNRPLSRQEILLHYNEQALAKGRPLFDTSQFGKLALKPYLYPEQQKAVLEIDYQWVQPLPEGAQIRAELARAGEQTALQSVTLKPEGPHNIVEASFSLAGLERRRYILSAEVEDGSGQKRHRTERPFDWPVPAPRVPPPSQKRVSPLPPPVRPPKYQWTVAPGGGFTVTVKGKAYRVESDFSFPHGGENRLSVQSSRGMAEPEWKVTTRKVDAHTYRVHAEGKFYTIDRLIRQTPTRIEVEDKITNKTEDVLGIIFNNSINTRGQDDAHHTLMANPTVFVSRGESGVGLVALDDLYSLQQRTLYYDGLASIRNEHFGLDKGASYTIRWAAYPTATADYYDFINQVRKDEGLHGHVEGALAFFSFWEPPSPETVELKALQYASLPSITRVIHNPTISLEGWEFMEYPDLCRRLKETLTETKRRYPGMKVTFHVAHSLFATNRPEKWFPDSAVIDENGNRIHYGPNTMEYYGRYFSKELVEDNWRWWIYYPTMENSFGKYMLRAADYMIEELGANAIWADGYISGYVPGLYTYDRWDGHSVTIDPKTKTVTRKKANVPYVSMPVLKAVARKFSDRGGVLITNGEPGPLSFCKEKVITSCETGGGDLQPISALHLGPTVTPLGNPVAIQSERDIYRDILKKLDLGALYFWYGEQDFLQEKTIVSHMYPITFESIHAGTVRGRERIVTKKPGVYGWQDDHALHAVYLSDARGKLHPNRFLTTVDADGVRTELALGENESAVVAKIPITLEARSPVNLMVRQYDRNGITIVANGKGTARFRIQNGDFPVAKGRVYRVRSGAKTKEVKAEAGELTFRLNLSGPTVIAVAYE